MVLHIIDDEKVTSRTIQLLDELQLGSHLYVCFYKGESPYHVKEKETIIFYDLKTHNLSEDIDFSQFDTVVLHALYNEKIDFYNKYLSHIKNVIWIAWGRDLYDYLLYYKGFKLYDVSPKKNLKCKIRDFLCRHFDIHSSEQIKALPFIKEKVKYLCSDDSLEFDLLKQYYPKYTKRLGHLDFFYYPIDRMLSSNLINKWSNNKYIFIGNSAVRTNNHLYIFKYLKSLNIRNRKLIAPLNYNIDDWDYLNKVIAEGEQIWGKEKFISLREFIPLDQYNELMLNADIYIYGFFRPQALGNIVIALYLGAKVFLPRRCPTYTIMKKRGIHIFALEDISNDQINTPLTQLEKEENRKIVYERYNRDSFAKLIKETFCPKSQDE